MALTDALRRTQASVAILVGACLIAGCGPRVLIATGTTLGLKATPGDGQSRPPQVTLGYKRAEAALIPTSGGNAHESANRRQYGCLLDSRGVRLRERLVRQDRTVLVHRHRFRRKVHPGRSVSTEVRGSHAQRCPGRFADSTCGTT